MEAVDWDSHALMLCDSIVYLFSLSQPIWVWLYAYTDQEAPRGEKGLWVTLNRREGPLGLTGEDVWKHTISLISLRTVRCLLLLSVPSIAILSHPLENKQNMMQDGSDSWRCSLCGRFEGAVLKLKYPCLLTLQSFQREHNLYTDAMYI